jgi:hypothetical protein
LQVVPGEETPKNCRSASQKNEAHFCFGNLRDACILFDPVFLGQCDLSALSLRTDHRNAADSSCNQVSRLAEDAARVRVDIAMFG